MRLLCHGQRSSLYKEGDVVYRHFHDTGAFAVVPTRIDPHGCRRYENNRTEASLVRLAAAPDSAPAHPPHLRRAREVLLASKTIGEVAHGCGVRRTTAWQYVTKVCEAHSDAARHVLTESRLVCPELEAAAAHVDLRGALATVMAQIEAHLDGNIVWRCEEDRYSQLRLLRVCLERVKAARVE